ncbi:MAG: hypothetical protein JWO49_2521 [Arthrobacter sp.]|nr:hypothetical protein [Arthrobacter sp.]
MDTATPVTDSCLRNGAHRSALPGPAAFDAPASTISYPVLTWHKRADGVYNVHDEPWIPDILPRQTGAQCANSALLGQPGWAATFFEGTAGLPRGWDPNPPAQYRLCLGLEPLVAVRSPLSVPGALHSGGHVSRTNAFSNGSAGQSGSAGAKGSGGSLRDIWLLLESLGECKARVRGHSLF